MAEEEFTTRPVKDEDELVAWGNLCARGFSHRPGAPDRFYKKYFVDPTAKLSWTRMVLNSKDTPVGSARVFDRSWSIGSDKVSCAGLGEVCTDPDYRGKGVATMILNDATRFCESATDAKLSALHAAATVGPLYERYGYRSTNITYSAVHIPSPASTDAMTCRQADFATDWSQLNACHEQLTETLGITGVTLRSEEYWRRWIPHVSGSQVFVLSKANTSAGSDLVAYACVLAKPQGKVLADAGLAKGGDARDFITVVSYAMQQSFPEESDWNILIPKPLARYLQANAELDVKDMDAWTDSGWMVRDLKDEAVAHKLISAATEGRFLVWLIDSF